MIPAQQLLDTMNGQNIQLPIFPLSIRTLIEKLSCDEISIKELSETLEYYPTIVIRLIALANSAWSKPTDEIVSLDSACVRLGLNLVRSVSLALAVARPFDHIRCSSFDAKKFWHSSFLTAEAAFLLAKHHPLVEPDKAKMAGLLHNIGLIWLVDVFTDEMNDCLTYVRRYPDVNLNETLVEQLGLGYDQAGTILATHLNLPDCLVAAIGGHRHCSVANNSLPLAEIVYQARGMVSSVLKHDSSLLKEEDESKIGIDPKDINATFNQLLKINPKVKALSSTLF